MAIPLPALDVKAPDIDPAASIGKSMQLRNLLLAGRGKELENQQQEEQLGATHALNNAYHDALTVDPDTGKTNIDTGKLAKMLAAGNHGAVIPGAIEAITKYQKITADLEETKGKVAAQSRDSLGFLGQAIQEAKYDPSVADLAIEERLRNNPPDQEKQTLLQMRQKISDPVTLKQMADSFVTQSNQPRERAAAEMAAKARMKQAEKLGINDEPLKDQEITQLNALNLQRKKVLDPNATLGDAELKTGATQKDADRVDKALGGIENAKGTQAQRDQANEFRKQTVAMSQQKLDMTPVTAQEKGKDVTMSLSEAQNHGLQDVIKTDDADMQKINAARHWLPLASNNDPNDPGIMQLMHDIESRGHMGVFQTRFQSFMKKFGGSPLPENWAEFGGAEVDPAFPAFAAKMGLSQTLLMNLHVGQRGGHYLVDKFEGLANADKMNYDTLHGALAGEYQYAKDRANLPSWHAPKDDPSVKVRIKTPKGETTIPADMLQYYKNLGATEVTDAGK